MNRKNKHLLSKNEILQALYKDNVYFIEDIMEGIISVDDLVK